MTRIDKDGNRITHKESLAADKKAKEAEKKAEKKATK